MKGIDLVRLKVAHRFLSQVVDRLVELEDLTDRDDIDDREDVEPDLEFEPLPRIVEVDGVTPHRHYHYDDDCCEGMRW